MASGSDVKKAAEAELELKVAGRPNKYTRWYGSTDEWCAMFVCYVCERAGVSTSIVPKTASVQVLYDFARNNRRFKAKDSGYTPKSGDIMIQKSNGASHTGIVVSASDDTFKTIEGNSGDAVKKCSYTLSSSSLTGFFVPDYKESDSGFDDDNDSTANEDIPLCSTSVVSTVNISANIKRKDYISFTNSTGGKYELHIVNNGIDYMPIVIGDVKWVTEWADTAGKLTFTILKDSNINITEGNVVIFKTKEYNVFYGYLFEKSRDKNGEISCTAYDQLRYFKNKDTYCYKGMTYTELLQRIAIDNKLIFSSNITDTKYKIPVKVEDDVTFFDMLANARKETLYATKKLYILYDDFGSLTIKAVEGLMTNYLLTEQGFEDFKYKTSIDNEVYNRIQFYKDDSNTGNRAKYIYEDGNNINAWGVLQKTIKLEDGDDLDLYAKKILDIYNQKSISLSVSKCFGNGNLRAGASLFLSLNAGDVVYDKALFFIVKATHNFSKEYTCDLEVAGQKNFVGEM